MVPGGTPVRRVAKRAVERALVGSGFAAGRLKRMGASAVILAYHNIVPRGARPAGDLSLHLDQEAFGDQLDRVLESHDVVPLERILDDPEPGGRPHRAAVTFDDGYVGTLTAGVEELAARDLPATVFVCPGQLGLEGFWWDRLADPVTGLMPDRVRRHALTVLHGRQNEVMGWASDSGLGAVQVPSHSHIADRDGLGQASADSRIQFGSHTWSHPNLAAIPDSEVDMEIGTTLDWLEASGLPAIRWLAYPYGLAPDGPRSRIAEEHRGALLVEGGHARVRGESPPDLTMIPRVNVPRGLTSDGLALRLAGVVRRGGDRR